MKFLLLPLFLIGCASPTAPTPPQPTPASTAGNPCPYDGHWTGTVCEYGDPEPPRT